MFARSVKNQFDRYIGRQALRYVLYTRYLHEKRKKRQLVNDGIWNFEHRQTADDDEGMDLCKKKIVAAECHLHGRRRASWFTSQIFFAHNSWSSRSKDQLSWACNNNDIIEEYSTKEADQLS